MINSIKIFNLSVLLLLSSCAHGVSSDDSASLSEVASRSSSLDYKLYNARQYADETIYLDVNVDSICACYDELFFAEKLTTADYAVVDGVARLEAAKYRFLKRCRLEDNYYSEFPSSASVINVSEPVYEYAKAYAESLNNATIESRSRNSEQITIAFINSDQQLEHNLNTNWFDVDSIVQASIESAELEQYENL